MARGTWQTQGALSTAGGASGGAGPLALASEGGNGGVSGGSGPFALVSGGGTGFGAGSSFSADRCKRLDDEYRAQLRRPCSAILRLEMVVMLPKEVGFPYRKAYRRNCPSFRSGS